MLAGLMRRLAPLERDTSPFSTPVPARYARGAHWVEPCQAASPNGPGDGSMRHPSWRGLHADTNPEDVHREG